MGKNEDSFFLNYLPISITLVSLEKAELPPFLGSTLRGVIGQALSLIHIYHPQGGDTFMASPYCWQRISIHTTRKVVTP